jgi:serine/threonine-protein kinase
VALKVALYPRDARFAREVELLSRIHHPSIPRLLDHGHWQHPEGTTHPYLAMEFVEGTPLYDWAQEQRPTSRRVLRLLAGLARALEATHAVGGVHRDVKGGNVLVRPGDDHVFLTDFGSGHYPSAATLTWQPLPPGTPAYRSPEAWRFVLRSGHAPFAHYVAGPADDVFALGVTAYRLVTQEYPPSTDPADEESRLWHQEGASPRPPRALNARCCPELSALISRMLSVQPETRGGAHELAEALARVARNAGPEADVPLFGRDMPRPESARAPSPRVVPQASNRVWRTWLTAATVGGPLALGIAWALSTLPEEEHLFVGVAPWVDTTDGGTVAVGDAALATPTVSVTNSAMWSMIALQLPPQPFPGQIRPDSKGRCPRRSQIPINGGCWVKILVDKTVCEEDGYVYKGDCYLPAFPPAREPVSSPAEPASDR